MTITLEEAAQAYRDVLGREPENEAVARSLCGSPDLDGARGNLRLSTEYLKRSRPLAAGGSLCKFADFGTTWFDFWSRKLEMPGAIHRKSWEWCIAAQALLERDCLRPGARGLGFAVGQEPLASVFATFGVDIDATDIAVGAVSQHWVGSNEHADGLDALHKPGIIDRAAFEARVRFFPADMRDLSSLPSDHYDFLWSSCALEHLGSLDNGMEYVRAAMRLLKPGGVAVHTTEFNISSIDDTIFEGGNVLYREQDLKRLGARLRREMCALEPIDLSPGFDPEDVLYDTPPYWTNGRLHIKLQIEDFICTSALLICRRYA